MAEQTIPIWDDIRASEQFQVLPGEERIKIRDAYFTDFIAPTVEPKFRAEAQKEWASRTDPLNPGVWSDVGNLLNMGWQGLALDARELTRKVLGETTVGVIDSVDRWWHGKPSEELLKGNITKAQQALTPEMQESLQKEWWDEANNKPGAALSDPRAYLGGLVQSIPGTAATMFPAFAIARGYYAAQLAAGIPKALAAAKAGTAASIAGSFTEGLQAAGQTSREVHDQIMGMTPEQLQGSDAMKSLLDSGLTFDQAKKAVAEDASTQAMIMSGVATGIFGGRGDQILFKGLTTGLTGNLAVRLAKGAMAEGLIEELPQSFLQRVSANIGVQAADPNVKTFDRAISEGIGGAMVGGLMGMGFTAFSGKAPTPAPAAAVRPSIKPIVEAADVNAAIVAASDFVQMPLTEETQQAVAGGYPAITRIAGLLPEPSIRVTPEGFAGTTSELQQATEAARVESEATGITPDVRRAQAQRYGTEPTAMMLAFQEAQRRKQEAQDAGKIPSDQEVVQEVTPEGEQQVGQDTRGEDLQRLAEIRREAGDRELREGVGAKPDAAVTPATAIQRMGRETEAALTPRAPGIIKTIEETRQETVKRITEVGKKYGAPYVPMIRGTPIEDMSQADLDLVLRTGTKAEKELAQVEINWRKAGDEPKFSEAPSSDFFLFRPNGTLAFKGPADQVLRYARNMATNFPNQKYVIRDSSGAQVTGSDDASWLATLHRPTKLDENPLLHWLNKDLSSNKWLQGEPKFARREQSRGVPRWVLDEKPGTITQGVGVYDSFEEWKILAEKEGAVNLESAELATPGVESDTVFAFDENDAEIGEWYPGAKRGFIMFPEEDPKFSRRAPFYSELAKKIGELPQAVASAGQWKGIISNLRGVKAAEVEAMGLNDWLDTMFNKERITKEEILNFIEKGGIQLRETIYGEMDVRSVDDPEIADAVNDLKTAGYVVTKSPAEVGDTPIWGVMGNTPATDVGEIITTSDDAKRIFGEDNFTIEKDRDGDWVARIKSTTRYLGMVDSQLTEEAAKDFIRVNYRGSVVIPAKFTDIVSEINNVVSYLNNAEELSTKHGSYKLPGAARETYRELVMSIPGKGTTELPAGWELKKGTRYWTVLNPDVDAFRIGLIEDYTKTQALKGAIDLLKSRDIIKESRFMGGHWDITNQVVSIRLDERYDDRGRKGFFVEEFQNDLAEGIRRHAISVAKDEGLKPNTLEFSKRVSELSAKGFPNIGLPALPFGVRTEQWVSLALKRVVIWAHQHGGEWVAWTTGEQQVERYSAGLRKEVDEIVWTKTPEGIHLLGYKGGEGLSPRRQAIRDQIAEIDRQITEHLDREGPETQTPESVTAFGDLIDERRRLSEEFLKPVTVETQQEVIAGIQAEVDKLKADLLRDAGSYRALLGGDPKIVTTEEEAQEAGYSYGLNEGASLLVYKGGWIEKQPRGGTYRYWVGIANDDRIFPGTPEGLVAAEKYLWEDWAFSEMTPDEAGGEEIPPGMPRIAEIREVVVKLHDAKNVLYDIMRDRDRKPVLDTTQRQTELSDALTKEYADQIINDPEQTGIIVGRNIKVTDTGMAGFYNYITPTVANKVLPSLGGGRVTTIKVDVTKPKITGVYPNGTIEDFEEMTDEDIEVIENRIGRKLLNFTGDQKPMWGSSFADVDSVAYPLTVILDRKGTTLLSDAPEKDFVISYRVQRTDRSEAVAWLKSRWRQASSSVWDDYEIVKGKFGERKFNDQQGFDITPAMHEKIEAGGGRLAMFARSGRRGPSLSVAEVQHALDDAISKVTVPVYIFAGPTQLAAEFRISGVTNNTQGVHWRGKIGLVASNITSALEAQQVFWHEGFHAGFEKIAPGATSDYQVELENIAMKNSTVREYARRWRENNGKSYTARLESRGWPSEDIPRKLRLMSFEEALARLSQENVEIKGLDGFVAALQKFIRAIGLDALANWMEGKTNTEALQLISRARDAISHPHTPITIVAGEAKFAQVGEEEPKFKQGAPSVTTAVKSGDIHISDVLRSDRTLNRVISKINTPFHIAETKPAFKKVYDLAQEFYADISRIALSAADRAPSLLPRIESFGDFLRKSPSKADIEATSRALYAGTFYGGGSPMEGVVFTDAELKGTEQFGRPLPSEITSRPLTDSQIKLYREALASVGYSLEEHSKSLVWRISKKNGIMLDKEMSLADMVAIANEEVDKKIEALRMETEAMDTTETGKLSRFETIRNQIRELNNFKDGIKDIETKTTTLTEHGYFPAMRFGEYFVYAEDAEGNQLHFGLYESQTAASLAKYGWQREFPTAKVSSGTMNKEAYKMFNAVPLDALDVFADHIKDAFGEDVDLDPIMQLWFRLATSERSIFKRQLHRKGTPGFSDDIPRVLAAFTVSTSRSSASHYHTGDMLRSVMDIKEGDLQAYATRYIRYLQDPQEESQRVRSFLANYYILGSVAFGAINLTQPVAVTIPTLSVYTGYTDAAKHVVGAAKDIVKGRSKLTGDEKSAFERAVKEGVVAPQELHQIRAESQAAMFGKNLGWRKFLFAWGSIYSLTEQFNRGTSFLAAYRMAEEMTPEKRQEHNITNSYDFAKEMVAATQFTYNRANRPELSRGTIGSVILTFKQFSISYVELATRLYATDKKAFGLMMLTLFVMAGLEGLPFAEDVEDLIDTIGQKLGYGTNSRRTLRRLTTEWLGKDVSNILLHGTSEIPGIPIDVASRLGMHNLIPGSALLKVSEPDKARDIVQILGPAASLFDKVVLKQDELALLPRAIQDMAKAGDMAMTGIYKDPRGRRVMDVTPVDAMFKLVGFQPGKVSRQNRIISQNYQDIAMQKVMEDTIALKWSQGIFEQNTDKVQEARDELRGWNESNPSLPIRIQMTQIQRRVKEMRRTREERFVRSAAPEVRRQMRQELRETRP